MQLQHRLRSVQVANWGTLDGYHRIEVPSRGLLVTGESGSGKSSLLDAMATLLVPPASLRFNAAAQQGDKGDQSRNAASYVRGAYRRETDPETDQIVTAYLRPDAATWSGIALTYLHGDGRTTSLVHLLHIPAGSNSPSDVSHLYVVAHEDLDLRELAPCIANGVNIRALHADHPDWFADRNHPKFSARMQRRLGFRDDQALQLLHKTQSAKNLNNLNQLLRDFMLDRPDTFALAEQAVNQFVELSSAHAGVVDTRRQVECLQPLTGLAEAARAAQTRQAELDLHATHMAHYVLLTKESLAARALGLAADDLEHHAVQVADAESGLRTAQERRDAAQRRVDGISGDLAQLRNVVQLRQDRADDIARRRAQLAAACRAGGLELPEEAAAFRSWQQALASADLEAELSQADERSRAAVTTRDRATQKVDGLRAELDSLATGSNISPALLAIREVLVRETGAQTDRLPFAGELIDVLPEHAGWQGAIERVLRPLAQTLLVPEDLYPQVAQVVDRTQLAGRLVYARMQAPTDPSPQPASSSSLLNRIAVAAGEHHDWLAEHLASRYDYACVDSVEDLARCTRGVTRLGQVKHNASRHEKDDRFAIDERTHWLLGSSVEAKRQALSEALEAACATEQAATDAMDQAWAERNQLRDRERLMGELGSLSWQQVDVAEARQALQDARAELETQLQTTAGLEEAQESLDAATAARDRAEQQVREAAAQHATARERVKELSAAREAWRLQLAQGEEIAAEVLEELARDWPLGEELPEVEGRARKATEDLHAEQLRRQKELSDACSGILQVITAYRRDWPAQSANLGNDIGAAEDYLAILRRLSDDGLPDFEGRFFEMLATQSRNNVGELASRVRASREMIRTRVKPINRSLRETEFAPGKHLQVKVRDRHLPEVRTFLDTLTEITAGALEDVMDADGSPESRQRAEQRFLTMKTLLDRLASSEPADVEWRAQVLDTRRHVDFRAVVIDEEGIEVDAFEGSGGLSGGERQKLVTFCLAAALRYQLAQDGSNLPEYALVVLDEAFDKTDPHFTRACLQVFEDFGFQLLLATPQKMLQALEDHVGGVALVVREDEGASHFEQVIFHDEEVPMLPLQPEQEQLV